MASEKLEIKVKEEQNSDDSGDHESEEEAGLSHQQAMARLKDGLASIIQERFMQECWTVMSIMIAGSYKNILYFFSGAATEFVDIVLNDPLLSELPSEVTLEEINSQIALEYGQAITVNVRRQDDIVLPIVVVQGATVLELKKAIQRHVALRQQRLRSFQHISWRYIWKTYWLFFEGQKLTDDRKQLKDYGIRNRDEVTFIKRLKQR